MNASAISHTQTLQCLSEFSGMRVKSILNFLASSKNVSKGQVKALSSSQSFEIYITPHWIGSYRAFEKWAHEGPSLCFKIDADRIPSYPYTAV